MTNTKIIAGIVAGAAIGAIAAILFSPGKGADTRQKISDTSNDWASSVKDCVLSLFKGKKSSAGNSNGASMNAGPGMNLNTMG